MMNKGVLLDTSFLIPLLDSGRHSHSRVRGYYDYFQQEKYNIFISTIAVAEYCVKGEYNQLPTQEIRILPFNPNHAIRAGQFARFIFTVRGQLDLPDRKIISNDTKLFSQADSESGITSYATADKKSIAIYEQLKAERALSFDIIDIAAPHTEQYGLLF